MAEAPLLLNIPTEIAFSAGAFVADPPSVKQLLLVVGEGLEQQTGLAACYAGAVNAAKVQICLRPAGEPDSDGLDRLCSEVREQPELIVAIGGGSTIDAAKGLALLLGSGGKIAEYEFGQRSIEKVVPLWAIPTTCGSGSEVTPYAVINNSRTGRKFTLADPRLLPQRAIVDPQLLHGLSPDSFSAGVFDAFIHALEAWLNRQGNLFEPLAEATLRIILNSWPGTPQLIPSAAELAGYARASLYGGLSIAHSRTGLIHTLSVAFARYVELPHGALNAVLTPFVLRFNQAYYHGRLAELLTRLCPERHWDDAAAVDFLCRWFEVRLSGAGSKLPVQVERSELIAGLADRVEQDKGLAAVNWRPLERTSLEGLIAEVIAHAF